LFASFVPLDDEKRLKTRAEENLRKRKAPRGISMQRYIKAWGEV
jgi:hypothetical protein